MNFKSLFKLIILAFVFVRDWLNRNGYGQISRDCEKLGYREGLKMNKMDSNMDPKCTLKANINDQFH